MLKPLTVQYVVFNFSIGYICIFMSSLTRWFKKWHSFCYMHTALARKKNVLRAAKSTALLISGQDIHIFLFLYVSLVFIVVINKHSLRTTVTAHGGAVGSKKLNRLYYLRIKNKTNISNSACGFVKFAD